MGVVSRYNVGGDEADILKNKLGITNPKELEDAETVLLTDSYDYFLKLLEQGKLKLNLELLFEIHAYFLGTLYPWAGKIRHVNISKNNAFFAPAKQISNALKQFELDFKKHKPKVKDSKKDLAKKLAFIHAELNVIHPFREGNGRTIRLFLDLMAVSVGYELLNFTEVSESDYIEACRKGMLQEYQPLESLFLKLLKKRKITRFKS
ncbi:MAG: Fic family protein [Candidatus Gracilibacteria bacterium]